MMNADIERKVRVIYEKIFENHKQLLQTLSFYGTIFKVINILRYYQ